MGAPPVELSAASVPVGWIESPFVAAPGFAVSISAGLLVLVSDRRSNSAVKRVLLGFVAFPLVSVITIEALSAFAVYRPRPVTVVFGIVALGALGALVAARRAPRIERPSIGLGRWETIVVAACGPIYTRTFLVALRN